MRDRWRFYVHIYIKIPPKVQLQANQPAFQFLFNTLKVEIQQNAKRPQVNVFFFVLPLSLDWLAVVMVVLTVCSAVCCPAVPSSTKYHPSKIGHRMRGSFGLQFQNKKPFQIELSRTKIFKKIQLCSNRLDSTFKIQQLYYSSSLERATLRS